MTLWFILFLYFAIFSIQFLNNFFFLLFLLSRFISPLLSANNVCCLSIGFIASPIGFSFALAFAKSIVCVNAKDNNKSPSYNYLSWCLLSLDLYTQQTVFWLQKKNKKQYSIQLFAFTFASMSSFCYAIYT